MKCGCVILPGCVIEHCPLHNAAPDLLALLKRYVEQDGKDEQGDDLHRAALLAIAEAEPDGIESVYHPDAKEGAD